MTEDYNLYPLHVFRAVARHGSVTRAAAELSVSQPAVSAHLKSLERRYGAPLVERAPRGVLLTQVGEVVLEQANRLFALYEEVPAVVDAARGAVRGEVTIAASSTPGAYYLPELLRRFQERHPEARPSLVVGGSAEVAAWLREYRAPLGVVGEGVASDELFRAEVGADELRLVAAGGDPIRRARRVGPGHLAGRTLLLREVGSSTRTGAERMLGEMIKEFGRVVEIRSAEAVKQAVASGLGLAVLSSWATRLEEGAGLLAPVRDPRFRRRRSFYLARRRDRTLAGTALALWEFLLTSSPRRR